MAPKAPSPSTCLQLAPMPHRRSVYLMQPVVVGRIEPKKRPQPGPQVSRRPHRLLYVTTRICWQIRRKKRACVWCGSGSWDHVRPLASLRVFQGRPGALSFGEAQQAAPVGHGGKLKTSRRAWRRRRQARLLVFSLPPCPTGAAFCASPKLRAPGRPWNTRRLASGRT